MKKKIKKKRPQPLPVNHHRGSAMGASFGERPEADRERPRHSVVK